MHPKRPGRENAYNLETLTMTPKQVAQTLCDQLNQPRCFVPNVLRVWQDSCRTMSAIAWADAIVAVFGATIDEDRAYDIAFHAIHG